MDSKRGENKTKVGNSMHFLNKMERKFGKFAIQGLMKYIILFYVAGYLINILAPQAYGFLTLEPPSSVLLLIRCDSMSAR